MFCHGTRKILDSVTPEKKRKLILLTGQPDGRRRTAVGYSHHKHLAAVSPHRVERNVIHAKIVRIRTRPRSIGSLCHEMRFQY